MRNLKKHSEQFMYIYTFRCIVHLCGSFFYIIQYHAISLYAFSHICLSSMLSFRFCFYSEAKFLILFTSTIYAIGYCTQILNNDAYRQAQNTIIFCTVIVLSLLISEEWKSRYILCTNM